MTRLEYIDDFATLLSTLRGLKSEVVKYLQKYGIDRIPNEEIAAQTWGHLLEQKTAIVLRLIDGDCPVGLLMGLLMPDMLTAEMVGVEVFWFVVPGYRAYSLELLKEFEKLVSSAGGKRIISGSMFTRQLGMRRLYRRLGYSVIGEQFEREL